MTGEHEEVTDLIGVGVQALAENADRLGLTWQLRLGTVVERGASPSVTMDGDDGVIGAVPMAGNPAIGQRVYVLLIPPGGAFMVGQVAEWETGSATITFASATTFTQVIIFNRQFIRPPRVFLNINSGSGNTNFWFTKAFNITTTQFTLSLAKQSGLAANAWTGHAVQWLAQST